MALGRIDYHLFDPWAPVEQILYPSISDFVAAWNTSQKPPIVAVRIVGHQQSARSHEVRDLLSRASVPYWFFSQSPRLGARSSPTPARMARDFRCCSTTPEASWSIRATRTWSRCWV